MPLKVVDQSGPVTLALGRVVLDLEKDGEPVASIEFSEFRGEYILAVRDFLTAGEVSQALELMNGLNAIAGEQPETENENPPQVVVDLPVVC